MNRLALAKLIATGRRLAPLKPHCVCVSGGNVFQLPRVRELPSERARRPPNKPVGVHQPASGVRGVTRDANRHHGKKTSEAREQNCLLGGSKQEEQKIHKQNRVSCRMEEARPDTGSAPNRILCVPNPKIVARHVGRGGKPMATRDISMADDRKDHGPGVWLLSGTAPRNTVGYLPF